MRDCSNKCAYGPVYRGTTPTFLVRFSEDVDANTFDEAYLTFEQAGRVILEKDKSAMTIDSEEPNIVTFTLSQEDTLAFRPSNVKYQLRFKIGELYYATQIWDIEAERILKDGAI